MEYSMNFLIKWLVFYAAVMFAMCTDNIFWISASPEYPAFKKKSFKAKAIYVLRDRVLAVLKHPRDIVPAIMTSFTLAVIF